MSLEEFTDSKLGQYILSKGLDADILNKAYICCQLQSRRVDALAWELENSNKLTTAFDWQIIKEDVDIWRQLSYAWGEH
jgi:hypothetical protein